MPRVLGGSFDRKEWSERNGYACFGESKTIQSQAQEADINAIVRNFGVTGKLPTNVRVPTYGDFDGVSDYREAIEAIRDAEKSFLAMPADLRAKLGNDPHQFVEWCSKEENLPEMRKLGLAIPLPGVEPPKE